MQYLDCVFLGGSLGLIWFHSLSDFRDSMTWAMPRCAPDVNSLVAEAALRRKRKASYLASHGLGKQGRTVGWGNGGGSWWFWKFGPWSSCGFQLKSNNRNMTKVEGWRDQNRFAHSTHHPKLLQHLVVIAKGMSLSSSHEQHQCLRFRLVDLRFWTTILLISFSREYTSVWSLDWCLLRIPLPVAFTWSMFKHLMWCFLSFLSVQII